MITGLSKASEHHVIALIQDACVDAKRVSSSLVMGHPVDPAEAVAVLQDAIATLHNAIEAIADAEHRCTGGHVAGECGC
jgi:polysaccharide deacetylase 2 family uncharacterized protein YibQ